MKRPVTCFVLASALGLAVGCDSSTPETVAPASATPAQLRLRELLISPPSDWQEQKWTVEDGKGLRCAIKSSEEHVVPQGVAVPAFDADGNTQVSYPYQCSGKSQSNCGEGYADETAFDYRGEVRATVNISGGVYQITNVVALDNGPGSRNDFSSCDDYIIDVFRNANGAPTP